MTAFPPAFEKRVKEDSFLGQALLDALNTPTPTSVRFNPAKTKPELPIESSVAWCDDAYYLSERPKFTLDPLFHAGAYYPQESGSMVLNYILKQLDLPTNPAILDLCAAPGGKSTLIASFLNNKGLLVSNEVINSRARILRENTIKWGYSNCIVTNNDPEHFQKIQSFFDVIVVDAPCSGEGMFRKDIQARNEWSEENVNLCSARQKRIVMDIWDSLKEGGYLIYSTCTFNTQENEENITWLSQETNAEIIKFDIPEQLKAGRNGIGLYCLPSEVDTEGFYLAIVRKTEATTSGKNKIGTKKITIQKDTLDTASFCKLSNSTLFNWNNQILAIPSDSIDDFLLIQSHMHILKFGINIGEISRKGIIPSEELALAHSLRLANQTIELDHQQALKYLHGDTFNLHGNLGFQLMTYKNEPLGWIKNIGNRFNNLYPKEWRIRMNVE